MADDMQRLCLPERDNEQAIRTLKRGAHLLKHGSKGMPKICPFRLSSDESTLIWFDGNEEKRLDLCRVSKITAGQRTEIFKRCPLPEKEYQSFSLMYEGGFLDLICKDKDEAEIWFTGLNALMARDNSKKRSYSSRRNTTSSCGIGGRRMSSSLSFSYPDRGDSQGSDNSFRSKVGQVFAEVVSLTAATRNSPSESVACLTSSGGVESSNVQTSGAEGFRASLSSTVSSSSQGSCIEDFNNSGDVYVWGEGAGDGIMGDSLNALFPKLLESTMALDIQTVACGWSHVVLVSKQGELFSWGEEAGGRFGHGVTVDASQPKRVEGLSSRSIEAVACGPYHSCAVTTCGEVYTWGGRESLYCGLLGHGSEVSHWIPKRIDRPLESLQVASASCGLWHTAFLTSTGRLFTFGDGTFGVLGHGDRHHASMPREVEALKELKTIRVACGSWHTAALVEILSESSGPGYPKQVVAGNVFTWGDGDKGRLGHGNFESKLSPEQISSLVDIDFSRVACGDNFTLALTPWGDVYAMGSVTSLPDGKVPVPSRIESNISDVWVEEVACGSHHVAILTSKGEVYTWGKGTHGQLGHGDNEDRAVPTFMAFFKDKQVKSIACGWNITAATCLHKGISNADNSVCSGCHNPFTFMRKRHGCVNCGLSFCKACSVRRNNTASFAPTRSKVYRVCHDCLVRLQRTADSTSISRIPTVKSESLLSKSGEERETGGFRRIMSRLSSTNSLKYDRSSIFSMKLDSNESRAFPLHNGSSHRRSNSMLSTASSSGSLQNSCPNYPPNAKIVSQSHSPVPGKSAWKSTAPSRSLSSSLLFSSENFLQLSLPDSKSSTQSPFPTLVPGKSSWKPTTPSPSSSCLPFLASEPTIDDLKSYNCSLSLEVKTLRAQAEGLMCKSRHLEAELERKLEQLKEATTRAAEEAEKNKAAKEMIESLNSQLKETSETVPGKQFTSSHIHINDKMTKDNNCPSNGYHATNIASPNSMSSYNLAHSYLSNGTRARANKSERTIQHEPGVYATIATLPNGVNELRKIRLSKKRFTKVEAQMWWTENGAKLCQRHNIQW